MQVSDDGYRIPRDHIKRRKLQNRLNQRKCRARRSDQIEGRRSLVVKQWTCRTDPRHEVGGTAASGQMNTLLGLFDDQTTKPKTASEITSTSQKEHDVNALPGQEKEAFTYFTSNIDSEWAINVARRYPDEVENVLFHQCVSALEELDRNGLSPSFSADHLLTLTYYNVLRGLVWNITILGLEPSRLEGDDYPSPFPPLSPTASPAIMQLPLSLYPTVLQAKYQHHPCLDLFPCPFVRDNIMIHEINLQGVYDGLCHALFGIQTIYDGAGPTLGGGPWEINDWEISEFLATRWQHIFKYAHGLQASTNRRRRARGWHEIYFA